MKVNKKPDSQTYYMPICMCLGMSLGTAIGAATDNMSMCMCLGMSFGLCIGSIIDARNRSKNKASENENNEEIE